MKQLVTLLAVVALGFFVYKHHQARSMKKSDGGEPKAVAISRVVEPFYNDLFSPLNQKRPADLVPPLEITKERILDMQTHAEPAKQAVYTRGIALLDAMIGLAEERTKALEGILRTAQGTSSLDGPTTTNTSSAFFIQSTLKRWEEEKRRQKAYMDQLFTALRTAERDWNKRAGKDARLEKYDLPRNSLVLITIDQAPSRANPLDRSAYDARRVYIPYRQDYYDRYGSSQSSR